MNTEGVFSIFSIVCCTELILCEDSSSVVNDFNDKTTLAALATLIAALSVSGLVLCAWCFQNKNVGGANVNVTRGSHVRREYVESEHRYVEIIDGNDDNNGYEEFHTYETVGRASATPNNGNNADKINKTSKNNDYETIDNVMI